MRRHDPGARASYRTGPAPVDGSGLPVVGDNLIDDDDLDVSDTVDDYLVGIGADVAVGKNMGLRVAVDTVSFDTLRPSVGLHVKF